MCVCALVIGVDCVLFNSCMGMHMCLYSTTMFRFVNVGMQCACCVACNIFFLCVHAFVYYHIFIFYTWHGGDAPPHLRFKLRYMV